MKAVGWNSDWLGTTEACGTVVEGLEDIRKLGNSDGGATFDKETTGMALRHISTNKICKFASFVFKTKT